MATLSPTRSVLILVILAAVLPIRSALAQDSDEQPPTSPDPIRLKFAQVNLELAESQLAERLEQNKKMPNFYAESELQRYRMNVAVAKRQLAAAQGGNDAIEVHLQHAKEQVQVAKKDYQRALEANVVDPTVYTKWQLNELRLKAELAKLRFAIWSNPESNLLSIFDQMHWQLERLGEEVLSLQRRVESLEHK